MLMDKKRGLKFLYEKSKKLKFEDPESKDFNEVISDLLLISFIYELLIFIEII